jgi:hypothetical protein
MEIWSTATQRRRRAKRFAENARAWYENCQTISGICGDVLYDQDAARIDTHAVFGEIDNLLRFGWRHQVSSVRRILHQSKPDLAQRFGKASEKVISLRNQTLRFLLRCQGPGPFSANGSANGMVQQIYYYRALDEFGFAARQLNGEVDRELQSIWGEVHELVIQAERQLGA